MSTTAAATSVSSFNHQKFTIGIVFSSIISKNFFVSCQFLLISTKLGTWFHSWESIFTLILIEYQRHGVFGMGIVHKSNMPSPLLVAVSCNQRRKILSSSIGSDKVLYDFMIILHDNPEVIHFVKLKTNNEQRQPGS